MTAPGVTPLQIVLSQPDEPLVKLAAEELQRYVRQLFGFTPPIRRTQNAVEASDPAPSHVSILIGAEPSEELPEQGYAIRPVEWRGHPALSLTGGSSRAVLWAAYEVVAAWGVHYLVQGDVFPDDAGPFHLPRLDCRREPVFPRREFRVLNDTANSGIFWSVEQHKKLFDQLARLRFTGILISTYAHHPWAHYCFRGVERSSAGLCYGWKHPVHERTIGRELFGNVSCHTNPDFEGAETYEEQLACGQRLIRSIFAAAHARGLEVTYHHPTSEVPDEFALKLAEFSQGVELPEGAVSQTHFSRHGLTYSGGPMHLERYRTPLNPVYVDLMETALVAHMQAYPDADRYGLGEQEFPPGGAGAEECWRILDEKYGVESILPLGEIKRRAGEQFFYAEGRALAQALGAVQTLRLYDILINERGVLDHAARPDARMQVTFFSEHLQPLVEHVLPLDQCDFTAIVDYLPARVAERMHTLDFVRSSPLDVTLITTIEDDNVGFLPQLVTPSLHTIMQRLREYGLAGFSFRQFDISQHEPAMAYMAEAAWDATVTPEDTYRRYALRVAGEEAADDLLAALRGVEALTEAANSLMGLGFMWPSLYSKHWEPGTRPDPAWREYTERLAPVEAHLERALERCAPRGRQLVDNYLHFIRFAGLFLRALDLIRQARAMYDRAQEAWEARDHVAYHPLIGGASDLLFRAESASEEALRTWAAQVADPTDLGSLAGLNAYGHDWLRGKCTEVYWESQRYGFTDMG